MPIQFNNDLQKFYDYIKTENDNDRANDDAAVQFGTGKMLGAATKTANAVRRWFCLSDGAVAARKANNEVRAALLTAVAREYNGLANIPESVRSVLKLKDFECEQRPDGSIVFKSGKPLTQRRISQIIDAVIADRNAQLNVQKDLLATVAPGAKFTRQESVLREVLHSNPRLMEKPGILNRTGVVVHDVAICRFLAFQNQLDKARQIDYLKNYQTHLRQAAQFTNDLATIASGSVNDLFNHQTVIDRLNAPDRSGKPADERRIALRKKILGDELFRFALGQMASNVYDQDAHYYLDRIHQLLWTENGQPSENVLKKFDSFESIVDIAHSFVTEVKARFAIDVPDEIVDGLITSACLSHFQGTKPDETQRRATGYVEMFQSVLDVCAPDRDKALKAFSGIVSTDVSKPKFVTLAKELVDSLEHDDLDFPAEPTDESMQRFCRSLAAKVHDKIQTFGRKMGEFGAQDIHDVTASFIMLLFTTREDARNWLQARSDMELEQFGNYMESNQLDEADDARAVFDDRVACHLVSKILAAKVYVA